MKANEINNNNYVNTTRKVSVSAANSRGSVSSINFGNQSIQKKEVQQKLADKWEEALGKSVGITDQVATFVEESADRLNEVKNLKLAGKAAKIAGKVGVVTTAVGAALDFKEKLDEGKSLRRAAVETGVSTAFSIGGAIGGAKMGALIGTAIAPGVGTAIGAGIGAIAGAVAGDIGGSWLVDKILGKWD